uniref:Methylmalonic aciduria type A protein, mitochondrial-like n=1 Tax=Phallusia mammillata TaxID=59560 RepID=A0A6F9DK93_9ASCI|nr:methylmalonic aciduria type A protein, mitochondrial-like [Phallusia mammillata]
MISKSNVLFVQSKRFCVCHRFVQSSSRPFDVETLRNQKTLQNYFPQDSYEQRTIKRLFKGVTNGNRASLAEAITLVESSHETKKFMSQILLQMVLRTLDQENSTVKNNELHPSTTLRIGITGPPGAGKSTFIETFGMYLSDKLSLKVSVLAVDPSSSRTGGSLLGDKTRMPELSTQPNAYVRPSPSRGELGGVARNTIEALLLCEGAGYDVTIVETVGVGQSEVRVADMTDLFVLIIPPAGGDELQGLKRGVIESCDMVLVNKSDGDLLPAARRIQTEYVSALKFIPRKHKEWRPRVKRVSAKQNEGIQEVWKTMLNFHETMMKSGRFFELRKQQKHIWMWNHIQSNILSQFKQTMSINKQLPLVNQLVENDEITPGMAADVLIKSFFKS